MQQFDPFEQSEGESESDEEECCSDKCRASVYGILLINAWLFLLVVIFAFQFLSYQRATAGEFEIAWRVKVAGALGMFVIGCVICFLFVPGVRQMPCPLSCLSFCFLFSASLGFFVAFYGVMGLPLTQDSKLTSVHTVMSIREGCSNGKLLDVSELLTYSAEPPKYFNVTIVNSAERILSTQVLPSGFVAQGIVPVQNIQLEDKTSFMPSKTDIGYSYKKPVVTLKFRFDQLKIFKGQAALQYSFRLNYTATLLEAKCKSAAWSQCGVWPEYQGSMVTELSLNCPIPAHCSAVKDSLEEDMTEYGINLNIPGLQIGSDACPFGWKKSPQSWIWYVGACFIALSAVGCAMLSFFTNSNADLCMLIPVLVCFGIGAIICGIAFLVDVAVEEVKLH